MSGVRPRVVLVGPPGAGKSTVGKLVAERLGFPAQRLAYQSRSGSPREPWLEPDIAAVIGEEARRGTRELLVVPIGFVCDHVEVLYDLDIEARQAAEAAGVGFTRAAAVNDHPSFIRLLAALVAAHRAG